jgi:hypothetical protein
MRSRGWCVAGLVTLVIATGGVSGCSGEPPHPLDSASPTASPDGPAFESPEAAFKAAVATYQRYLEIVNLASADGEAGRGRLSEVMSPELAGESAANFEALAADGLSLHGASTLRNSRLIRYSDHLVQMYVCLDAEATRVLDQAGADVTPPDRRAVTPLVVSVEVDQSGSLSVSKSEDWPWEDDGIC